MAGGHVNREGHPVFQDALTGEYPYRFGERGAHILVQALGMFFEIAVHTYLQD